MAKHHRQELAASARKILSQTTLADYLASRPPSHVVTLDSATATVGSALEALSRASILSAPLTGPEGEVLGFLSVGDCVSAFLAGKAGERRDCVGVPRHSSNRNVREIPRQPLRRRAGCCRRRVLRDARAAGEALK